MVVRTRSARGASGQHFLRSSRLAADLVFDAEVAADDLIVEIGGGTGVLTRALLGAGAVVISIERDPVLAAGLRKRFRDVDVVTDDAEAHTWPEAPFSVVANLPFARSGAILAHLLRKPGVPLRRAEVIVQWEFAAKHSAIWPATLRSTYWRAWYDVSIVRRLDRTAFVPPPSVDAAVVRFTRRGRPRVPAELHDAYWGFIAAAFALRGPIKNGLRPLLSPLEGEAARPGTRLQAGCRRSRPRRRAVGSSLRRRPPALTPSSGQVTVCYLAGTARFRARAALVTVCYKARGSGRPLRPRQPDPCRGGVRA